MVATSHAISFFVAGEPVPQGSSRAFVVKGRAVVTHGNKSTMRWRERIATEAQHAMQSDPERWPWSEDKDLGYTVSMVFRFTRPKSAPKKRTMNTKRPDLDKLVRACLDGITNVLIPDDAQVISIDAEKEYAGPTEPCGIVLPPGVQIIVTRRAG